MKWGKLRVLGANDPDPYPDAARLDAFAPVVEKEESCVSLGGRTNKRSKSAQALRAAMAELQKA